VLPSVAHPRHWLQIKAESSLELSTTYSSPRCPSSPARLSHPLLITEEVGRQEKLAQLFQGFLEGFALFLSLDLDLTGPSLGFLLEEILCSYKPK